MRPSTQSGFPGSHGNIVLFAARRGFDSPTLRKEEKKLLRASCPKNVNSPLRYATAVTLLSIEPLGHDAGRASATVYTPSIFGGSHAATRTPSPFEASIIIIIRKKIIFLRLSVSPSLSAAATPSLWQSIPKKKYASESL